jgi:photosystem II stability/assembly factor-like uncharacterized protein
MKLAASLVIMIIALIIISSAVIIAISLNIPPFTMIASSLNNTATNNGTNQNGVAIQWKKIGPTNISYSLSDNSGVFYGIGAGKIDAFVQNYSNPVVMYAAGGGEIGPSSDAGIFKSVNGGETWFPVDNGLESMSVNALLIDKANNDVILAATPIGIYLSQDGGANWQLMPTTSGVSGLTQINESIYAAVGVTILKSSDGGKNWGTVYTNPSGQEIFSITSAGNMLYVGLNNGEIVSHTAGTTFWDYSSPMPSPQPQLPYSPSLSASQSNPDLLYVSEFSGYGNTSIIYRSTDGGVSWTTINISSEDGDFSAPGAGAIQVVAVDPSNSSIIYAGADLPVFRSNLGGKSFSPTKLIVDVRMIGFYGKDIVIGSDQGLYESADGGLNWTGLNGNLTSSIVYSVEVANDTIFASMQDYSPIASFDGGKHWESLWNSSAPGGEGGVIAFDPYNASCIYFGNIEGFSHSMDGGHVFVTPAGMKYILSWAFNRSLPNEVLGLNFTGKKNGNDTYTDVYSTNCGKTWSATGWPVNGFTSLFTSPLNPDLILASNYSGVYYTEDAWRTLTKSQFPISKLLSVNIAFDPLNSSVVLAAAENVTLDVLLRSTDGGKSFYIEKDFLDEPISQLEFAPHSNIVFTITINGLFVSTDGGLVWRPIKSDLGTIYGITINGTYVYIGTEGNGILRAPLSDFNVSS